MRRRHSVLKAKRPGHLWLLDFTRVGGLLRTVFVGAVIDGSSRKVLALGVAPDEAPPQTLVTAEGRQFTSTAFRWALEDHGASHVFGRVGLNGSCSLIEAFWKSFHVEFADRLFL